MIFIENLGKTAYVLIISIIIIASVLIILITIERKLNKRRRKKNPNMFYISEIKKINKSHPKKILKSLDKIARSFFEEAFKIRTFTGYSELKKFFIQKKNIKAIEFCELIDKILYSEEKNSNKIQRLTNLLIEVVETNKIISKEEQIKIEKNKPKDSLRERIISRISKKKLENKKNNRKND